jgi:hypothetical protein
MDLVTVQEVPLSMCLMAATSSSVVNCYCWSVSRNAPQVQSGQQHNPLLFLFNGLHQWHTGRIASFFSQVPAQCHSSFFFANQALKAMESVAPLAPSSVLGKRCAGDPLTKEETSRSRYFRRWSVFSGHKRQVERIITWLRSRVYQLHLHCCFCCCSEHVESDNDDDEPLSQAAAAASSSSESSSALNTSTNSDDAAGTDVLDNADSESLVRDAISRRG